MNDIVNTKKNVHPSVYNMLFNKNKIDAHDKQVKDISPSFDLQKNFLTLLIAQIQNQDPIDPIKNTELTSQLAQINTVGQIEKLNHTVEKLQHQSIQKKKIETSTLLGRHVMTRNSQLIHTKNTPTKFGIELLNNAKLVQIKIKDAENNIVFVKNVKNLKTGFHHFLWDGKNLDKKNVETGQYTISADAKNDINENIIVHILRESVVESIITNSPNVSNVIIDLGAHGITTLENIYQILA